ncbi:class A beta-lactamase [Sphingomonas ginsenosidivorax]|nr:class A beta-lactamase [Sphingomonas ginsenosidivorax]
MRFDNRNPINRRTVLVAGAAALASQAMPTAAAMDEISALERRYGGRLGVFALDLETGRTFAHRKDQRFKLQSTFKGLLAALVLADVSRGAEKLDGIVHFGKADLLPASPVTEDAVARGQMTVRELCEAIMYRSDNTAANLLMTRRGGPDRLTRFLRGLGDDVTRTDSYEGHMNGRPAAFDTTSPQAIVKTVRTLLLGSALPPSSQRQLETWMEGNVVGRTRLRAAFPSDWRSGDRTGTGDGVCNDYAIARRPGRAPLVMSAYYAAPGMRLLDQEAVIRSVGRTVVEWQKF